MKNYLIQPGKNFVLRDFDPNDTGEYSNNKNKVERENIALLEKLSKLQEILYAEHKHKILIVLQAMDTGGKDGVIRHVFSGVNPMGVKVVSFKAPTYQELDHDYLWRVHSQSPQKGEIVLFNRSHYEDVLVVRAHSLVPKEIWSRRYQQINDFECMLHEEGTIILKFYLHIDKQEQKERLLDRLKEPDKQWKFIPNDLKERALWDDYMIAYEDMLNKTSTEWAPWYIVPSNVKWYRNLVVASTIVERLTSLDLQYPEINFRVEDIKIDD